MIAEPVTVTTVGMGDGADADFLRAIADAGGGRYHHVPDPNSLPRIFTRETEMISRQAAVEEWFPVNQTAPADFLKGIAINTAPLLHGYVATEMKAEPAQQILASDKNEPILARMRVGMGQTLAWTSDVKNLWAADWLRWPAFSRFWGQLVREHMRKRHHREIPMKTEVEGGRVRATVDAFTPDERFDNAMQSTLKITRAGETSEPRSVPLRQTAPGRYEADFPLNEYGSFALRVDHAREGKDGDLAPVGVSYSNISNPYPREYSSFEPDVERLERVAAVTAGAIDPKPERLFDAAGQHVVYRQHLWPKFILAAFVAFLLDLLVRRVRLFDRKFVVSKRRRAAA
jgi:hypothetical protein